MITYVFLYPDAPKSLYTCRNQNWPMTHDPLTHCQLWPKPLVYRFSCTPFLLFLGHFYIHHFLRQLLTSLFFRLSSTNLRCFHSSMVSSHICLFWSHLQTHITFFFWSLFCYPFFHILFLEIYVLQPIVLIVYKLQPFFSRNIQSVNIHRDVKVISFFGRLDDKQAWCCVRTMQI